MENRSILRISVLFLCWRLTCGQSSGSFTPNDEDRECFKFDSTCSDCIRNPQCQWCSDFKAEGDYHCFSSSRTFTAKTCLRKDIKNPLSSITAPQNDPLSEVRKNKRDRLQKTIQMRPQKLKLALRKNDPQSFEITYRQLEDYPLDLYYLMDMSRSMRPHKETLARLGHALAIKMRNLTSRFRLGFGTFVDKVLLPYVNTDPYSLQYPCGYENPCVTPFSFKNNLPLTDKDEVFKTKVGAASISSNLDSPEGGFDGLMQAMVCKEEIGWSKGVRKIIVFSTDASSHMAGDGKLAGVIKPNDGKCRLNKDGVYDKFDEYDYPSVGLISETSQKEGVNIIFAIAGGIRSLYNELSKHIKGSSYASLSGNSNNIVDQVAKIYKSITGRVEIQQNSDTLDKHISVKVQSNCDKTGNPFKPIHYCEGVQVGRDLTFRVTVELTECPRKITKRNKTIRVGTLHETVEIEIEMLCDCNCEIDRIDNKACNGAGSMQCGVCICNEASFGKECQCSTQVNRNSTSRKSETNKCKDTLKKDAKICSGQGSCECETCVCDKKSYEGKFCECNTGLCRHEYDSWVSCSGNGICQCEECKCNQGWTGKWCQCPDINACKQSGSDKVCSGNGECECGLCSCSQEDILYTGEFCDECPNCESGRCDEFGPCVQCKQFRTGELHPDDCEKNCTYAIHSVKSLEEGGARLCTRRDEEKKCDFRFTYKYISKDNYQIYAMDEQDCPEPLNFLE